MFERAESTLPVVAFDFCFIKTSRIVAGVTADEGAACLVLLDVDTVFLKAVPAAERLSRIVWLRMVNASWSNSSDVVFHCVWMGNPRFLPVAPGRKSFFLSCWNELHDMTVKQTLLNELSGRSRNKSKY